MCSQQVNTWLWGSRERSGLEASGIMKPWELVRSPRERVRRERRRGPKGTKTFKGHAGEEELLQREGKERQNKEQSEVSQQIWHRASDDAEGQDGNRPESVRGILQQDVCIGSVAGGLRGVLGTDVEVREWGWRHVFQEAWF